VARRKAKVILIIGTLSGTLFIECPNPDCKDTCLRVKKMCTECGAYLHEGDSFSKEIGDLSDNEFDDLVEAAQSSLVKL